MSSLSKGFRGYVVDGSKTAEWTETIGKLILNFGAVELNTYFWLEALSSNDMEVINASKKQFSWRLHRVIKLIKARKFPPEIEAEMLKIWGCSEELSKLRNKVAHNPLFFSYSGREPDGVVDTVGIPAFRKSKTDETPFKTVPLCSLEYLKVAVDAVHENVENLSEFFDNHLKMA